MELIIKSATVIDSSSPFHQQQLDLLIRDGVIEKIAKDISEEKIATYSAENLHVSPGWFDMGANFQDPGAEYKEDLESGLKAAAAGGFTAVALSPATQPTVDNKSAVQYLINKSKENAVDVYPKGALSVDRKGKELAELNDMKMAGAVAFTDDKAAVRNPNLLNRALMYNQAIDGLVINFPHTHDLAPSGVMNEGVMSTVNGLKGIPELGEELMVSRDISILEYCGGRLHFATVSAAKSIDLIKAAKEKGMRLSADVAATHLLLNDESLEGFDSRFKVLPPFRSEKSRQALIEGLKSGVIDVICSDHQPEDIEAKKREFDHAAFGIISLQTAFAAARTSTEADLPLADLIDKFTHHPRKVLQLDEVSIQEGKTANLSLFDPEASWQFSKDMVISKSANSPLFGRNLKGKVLGIINKDQFIRN